MISTFSSTAIISSTMFTNKTIALINPTTNVVYLTSFPEATTAQAVIDGVPLFPEVNASSNTLVLPSYHGGLYGVVPRATGSQTIQYLGGQ